MEHMYPRFDVSLCSHLPRAHLYAQALRQRLLFSPRTFGVPESFLWNTSSFLSSILVSEALVS